MSYETEKRRTKIVNHLQAKGTVYVTMLSKLFNVTPETIRRDLAELELQNSLKRIHGGAVMLPGRNKEFSFVKKQNINKKEKQRIGEKAAQFIHDGDTVLLDVGTTVLELAKAVRGVEDVTFITNSLPAANTIGAALEQNIIKGKLILLGGNYNPEQQSITGSLTIEMLHRFRVDKAFLSCGGITVEGVSDYDIEEASVTRKMLEISRERYVLADHTKINRPSFALVAPLQSFEVLITGDKENKEWEERCEEHDVYYILAEGGE